MSAINDRIVTIFARFYPTSETPWEGPTRQTFWKQSSGWLIRSSESLTDTFWIASTFHGLRYSFEGQIYLSYFLSTGDRIYHQIPLPIEEILVAPELDLVLIPCDPKSLQHPEYPTRLDSYRLSDLWSSSEESSEPAQVWDHRFLHPEDPESELMEYPVTLGPPKLYRPVTRSLEILIRDLELEDHDLYEEIEIEGLSGAPLTQGEQIIGQVMNHQKNSYQIGFLPSHLMVPIFSQMWTKGEDFYLKHWSFGTQICQNPSPHPDEEPDSDPEAPSVNLMVQDSSDSEIPPGDLIVQVNHLPLQKDGWLQDPTWPAGWELPVKTWASWQEKLTLSIWHQQEEGEYEPEHRELCLPEFQQALRIPIHPHLEFFSTRGLVFVQLTEHLLQYYFFSGKKLHRSLQAHLTELNKATESGRRALALVGYNKEKLSNSIARQFQRYNLPFIRMEKSHYDLAIVSKIDHWAPHDLTQLEKRLSLPGLHQMYLKTSAHGNYLLHFDDHRVVKLEKVSKNA